MSKSRFIFGLLLLLVSLSSCRPGKVLSRSEMADVLYDLHLAEALVDNPETPVSPQWTRGMSPDDFRDMSYQSVLRKHDITQETFYASVSYYSKHLRIYSKIYIEVDKRLQDFITSIGNEKYAVPTLAEVLAGLKPDTLKMKEQYTCILFKPDTIGVKSLFLPADSLPSFAEWNAGQWLRKTKKKAVVFSLVSHIPQVVADTTAVVGTVNPLDTAATTKTILKQEAVGKVTKEIVAVEARKLPPQNRQEARKKVIVRERLMNRSIGKKQPE